MNYDLDYYEIMLRQNCATAQQISEIRWDFVADIDPKVVLDYGSGAGFFRAFRPSNVIVYTYDTGEDMRGNYYPQTGWPSDKVKIDLVCFWDVLEHIRDLKEIEDIIRQVPYIAISIPIVRKSPGLVIDRRIEMESWKHFKPGEHVLYFTEETLSFFFMGYGFRLIKEGTPECPPRVDIWSAIFKKMESVKRRTGEVENNAEINPST